MKIAVDFDGVIVERSGIPRKGDFFDCQPTQDAVEAIIELSQKHELYVFTNREKKDWKRIERWLYEFGLPSLKVTNIKQKGTAVYIDDRAVRFTNWLDITKYFA